MKTIAVTATHNSLDAPVGPRFARERYVILVDPETLEWEAVDNLQHLALMEGVGVHLANFLARKNVTAVLTGHCGPRAFQELAAHGIKVFLDNQDTVREAVSKFKFGEISPAQGPNVPNYSPTGSA